MIDRTPKLYIGGKQTRPDSGYSITVLDAHKNGWGSRTWKPQGHPECGRGGP